VTPRRRLRGAGPCTLATGAAFCIVIAVVAQQMRSASSSHPKEQLTYKHSLRFDVDEQATRKRKDFRRR